jgi:hypothetical protein
MIYLYLYNCLGKLDRQGHILCKGRNGKGNPKMMLYHPETGLSLKPHNGSSIHFKTERTGLKFF